MYKYLLFILPLLLSCCMREDAEPVVPGGDDLDVKFVLQKNASSRAMDADAEDYIGRIDVLAFKVNGSAETFAYHAKAKTIDNANRQFTVTLRRGGSDSYRFVIVANLENSQGDALSHIAATGVKEEVLKKWLTIRNTGKWNATGPGDFRPIPMWGETGVMQITESTASSGISGITIVRMLSRIDVELTTLAARNNFKLVQVDLYNRKTRGYAAPLKVNWDEATHTATAVSMPEDNDPADPLTVFDPLEYKTATTAGAAFEKAIYTFEADGVTESDRMDATSIVVGGYYDPTNNSTEMSYYRIDIKPETAALLSRSLKRNHNYHVGISVIGKKGAGSSEDAFYGDFTLAAEITEWDNANQNVILDGQYFLRLSQPKISLWSGGNTIHLIAETNYDGKYNNAGNAGVRLDYAWGVPDWRHVSVTGPTIAGGVYTYDINVRVDDLPTGQGDRWNAFWVQAGNMQVRMDIWQGSGAWFSTDVAVDYEPGNTRYEITTTTLGGEKWRISAVSDPDEILFSKDQYVGMTGTNYDKLPFYIREDALPGKVALITFENINGDNPPVTIEIRTKS